MDAEPPPDILEKTETERIRLVEHSASDVPGFTDLKKIADGASGVVYAAKCDADMSDVAIKIYKKELVPDSESMKRFLLEVSTLQKIDHPNIVKILSSGTTASGQCFIAMELIEGVSIRTLLDTDGVFEVRRAVVVTREICRALAALHAKAIIHRDLKPNNVVLSSNNVAKLVDFNIAKVLDSSNDTITQYGSILGTPSYMSPEQCLGQKVDERSDVYSVGCTLFEMLTGIKAFDSASAIEVLAKQIDADRSFIEKPLISAGASADLRKIVMKCLDRQADNRYKNVAELDHELSAFLLGARLSFSGGSGYRTRKTESVFAFAEQALSGKSQAITCCAAILLAAVIVRFNIDAVSNTLGLSSPRAVRVDAPVGQVIRSRRNNAIIFSDPSAHNIMEAVNDAAARQISLHYADLRAANLEDIKLNSIDLSYADLTNALFSRGTLTNVNLHGAVLTNASFVRTKFVEVDFSAAQLVSANFNLCYAGLINFTGADLRSATLVNGSFEHSNFRYANLSYANIVGAKFYGADMSFADFTGIPGSIYRNVLQGANLNGAKNFGV